MVDLYRETGEVTRLESAKRAANTFRSRQNPDGSWDWLPGQDCHGNRPFEIIDPAPFLYFFGKLRVEGGVQGYTDVEEKARQWVYENSSRTLKWQNEYGCSHHQNYLNYYWYNPIMYALYLLDYAAPEDVDESRIREAARWVEDQFMAWNRAPQA